MCWSRSRYCRIPLLYRARDAAGSRGKSLECPQRDCVLVLDVDSLAGDHRIGVCVAIGDFVARELLEFLSAGLEHDKLAGGRKRNQDRTRVNDRTITAASAATAK